LATFKVVQSESEIAVMKWRCEQAHDLLHQDKQDIDGKIAAHQIRQAELAAQQASFVEQEATFAAQALATKLALQAEMMEREQHAKTFEQDTVVRCLAAEHEVDRACAEEVANLKLREEALSAEHESECASMQKERIQLAEERSMF
jgi:hypothetical protein